MMVSGKMIKQMEKEFICSTKEADTKEIGSKTSSMDKDKKCGLMALIIKDNISRGKNTAREK